MILQALASFLSGQFKPAANGKSEIRQWCGLKKFRCGANDGIGAGAAVVRGLPDGVSAVGLPARLLSPI
ncbi:hypothetical protein [Vulcanococcus limneticus]|uniref:hypothetical protein n=1 Tax=Vulcanococcus limneticus TaxID=2170428 RepID=UPI00398BC909